MRCCKNSFVFPENINPGFILDLFRTNKMYLINGKPFIYNKCNLYTAPEPLALISHMLTK